MRSANRSSLHPRVVRQLARDLRLVASLADLQRLAPVRHEAKRRRIKTVMQELACRTGRLIEHGCQLILGLGASDRAAAASLRLRGQLPAASGWTRRARPGKPGQAGHPVPSPSKMPPMAWAQARSTRRME